MKTGLRVAAGFQNRDDLFSVDIPQGCLYRVIYAPPGVWTGQTTAGAGIAETPLSLRRRKISLIIIIIISCSATAAHAKTPEMSFRHVAPIPPHRSSIL